MNPQGGPREPANPHQTNNQNEGNPPRVSNEPLRTLPLSPHEIVPATEPTPLLPLVHDDDSAALDYEFFLYMLESDVDQLRAPARLSVSPSAGLSVSHPMGPNVGSFTSLNMPPPATFNLEQFASVSSLAGLDVGPFAGPSMQPFTGLIGESSVSSFAGPSMPSVAGPSMLLPAELIAGPSEPSLAGPSMSSRARRLNGGSSMELIVPPPAGRLNVGPYAGRHVRPLRAVLPARLSSYVIMQHLRREIFISVVDDGDNPTEKEPPCAICLEDFEDGEVIAGLDFCTHIYHVHCIKQWLEDKNHCPLCRRTGLDVNKVVVY